MPTDPKKPVPDKEDSPPSEEKAPADADEALENIEEEGEPFDGNFA